MYVVRTDYRHMVATHLVLYWQLVYKCVLFV